jgi:serine/threonine protein phosphatase PrpC
VLQYSVKTLTDVGSRGINEDTFFISNNLFAVFDGASPLIKPEVAVERRSGGQVAAEIAMQTFADNPEQPLNRLAVMANQNIRQAQALEVFDAGKAWSTTIAAVRIINDQLEYLSVGDSPIIAIYPNNTATQISKFYDWDVKSLELWKKLVSQGVNNPRQHPFMKDQVLAVRRKSNTQYGYCNGDPKMANFIDHGRLLLENVKAIALLTDGFMLPKQNLEAPDDWDELAARFAASKLEGILGYIRALEKSDKNCQKYPRFKTHDDATAIVIEIKK